MLIATITALLLVFGGGSSDLKTLSGRIEYVEGILDDYVKDQERRDKIVPLLAEIGVTREAYGKQNETFIQQLLALDERKSSTREQYRQLFARVSEASRSTELKLVDLRFQIREHFTREEWNAMFKKLLDEADLKSKSPK